MKIYIDYFYITIRAITKRCNYDIRYNWFNQVLARRSTNFQIEFSREPGFERKNRFVLGFSRIFSSARNRRFAILKNRSPNLRFVFPTNQPSQIAEKWPRHCAMPVIDSDFREPDRSINVDNAKVRRDRFRTELKHVSRVNRSRIEFIFDRRHGDSS